jgi:hypothetical protein
MSVMWDPGILGDDAPTANCRGCGTGILLRAGYWQDVYGIAVCVKARLEDTGQGERPDYVFHEPMPEGLRGAPE